MIRSLRSFVGYSVLATAAAVGGVILWEGHSALSPSQAYAQQAENATVARNGLQSEAIAGADLLSAAFRNVAKSLKPSVVSIKSVVEQRPMARGSRRNPQIPNIPPEFRKFFGEGLPGFGLETPDGQSGGMRQEGTGSGVIVSSNGHILTNNHVVEGATKLEVQMSDKRVLEAKVIGTDPKSDIAVIKIEATGLVAAPIGDSSLMQVGDWVIAIGSPFELSQTVTSGIVSATNRDDVGITAYDDFIQTDAAINPGNSGGPLLNLHGEVIGINTAIASRSGGFNGIGFAIPSNTADLVLKSILDHGKVTRGFLGTQIGDITPDVAKKIGVPNETIGAVISAVAKGGPADKGGLQPGDVVTGFNGEKVVSSSRLRRMVASVAPGTKVKFDILRNGKPTTIQVVIEEQTDEKLAAMQGGNTMSALGIVVESLTQDVAKELGLAKEDGVLVSEVSRDSPLFGSVQPGEVIFKVNNQPVSTPEEFAAAIGANKLPIRLDIRNATSERMVLIK
ncbi:MAG: Do family serine endopeptidase [Pirellulaceae bacterium]|nr:Do family serine endopeptidase [Pirellulaceae bacterium]